jgi:hypothetical protein
LDRFSGGFIKPPPDRVKGFIAKIIISRKLVLTHEWRPLYKKSHSPPLNESGDAKMPIISSHRYSIDSLLPVFQAALDRKLTRYPAGSWQSAWPEGNSDVERAVVDFLKAAKAGSATELLTTQPLSDAEIHGPNPCGNVNHSLYMQIRNKMIKQI